ncbi:hypothetical protein HHK36_008054 [Tetracentron sinense]|uniref:peptidylprolyl isomerase n=1 Tax=Tetracentron sinense TaxID=13715 RepID=A0A834ZEV0_TETSI|nr:hypothetical protein HHK36_008054 [Tetracentron sinense]
MAVSTLTVATVKPHLLLQPFKPKPSFALKTSSSCFSCSCSNGEPKLPLESIPATKRRFFDLGIGLLAASMVISSPLDANATRIEYYATVGEPSCELSFARSGLGFCDVAVGTGVEAPYGELINARLQVKGLWVPHASSKKGITVGIMVLDLSRLDSLKGENSDVEESCDLSRLDSLKGENSDVEESCGVLPVVVTLGFRDISIVLILLFGCVVGCFNPTSAQHRSSHILPQAALGERMGLDTPVVLAVNDGWGKNVHIAHGIAHFTQGRPIVDLLSLGSDATPLLTENDAIHYTARFADGRVFDSSYKRARPLTMRIGVGKVIKGLDQGIFGGEGVPPMLVGGKRKLQIPPELAYGPEPAGCFSGDCNIPANATLVYDIKFVAVYK